MFGQHGGVHGPAAPVRASELLRRGPRDRGDYIHRMNAADEAKAIELLEHDDEVCRKVVAAINAELARRDVA